MSMKNSVPTPVSTSEEIEAYLLEEASVPNGCGRQLMVWLSEVATTDDDAYARRCSLAIVKVEDSLPVGTIPQSVLFVTGHIIDRVHDKRREREKLASHSA